MHGSRTFGAHLCLRTFPVLFGCALEPNIDGDARRTCLWRCFAWLSLPFGEFFDWPLAMKRPRGDRGFAICSISVSG